MRTRQRIYAIGFFIVIIAVAIGFGRNILSGTHTIDDYLQRNTVNVTDNEDGTKTLTKKGDSLAIPKDFDKAIISIPADSTIVELEKQYKGSDILKYTLTCNPKEDMQSVDAFYDALGLTKKADMLTSTYTGTKDGYTIIVEISPTMGRFIVSYGNVQ